MFNFFQTRSIDLWNKIRTAIEIIGTGILRNELEEIKVFIGIKLNKQKISKIKIHENSVVLLKRDDIRREI